MAYVSLRDFSGAMAMVGWRKKQRARLHRPAVEHRLTFNYSSFQQVKRNKEEEEEEEKTDFSSSTGRWSCLTVRNASTSCCAVVG